MTLSEDLSALEFVPDGVVVLASDGTIVYRNQRAARLLGLDSKAVGSRFVEAVDLRNDTGERVMKTLAPSTAPASPVADRLSERLVRARLPDGHERPLAVAGRLFDDGTRLLSFRHAGRRERLDRSRSDLIATVSHEIRSPLTSVKGFTRTMLAKWDQFSDEQKRQMLATINEDADRVTRLLTELLDVARIDAGRVQLHRRMVDIGGILLRVVGKVEHHEDGRAFDVRIPDGIPELYLDPDKVEQVFTNLVENALRYAPESEVHVTVSENSDTVEVVVRDDGPGIPADQLRHIFGKFSRGRDNRRAGTGLGLFITKGLVEAHGGHVWAESEEGKGSAFHVRLPKGGLDLVR